MKKRGQVYTRVGLLVDLYSVSKPRSKFKVRSIFHVIDVISCNFNWVELTMGRINKLLKKLLDYKHESHINKGDV